MPKRILSIDGGGIRGIIPLCALVALESRTGVLAREHFGFVAGTSTGAIIAAAAASGMPAREILDLYCRLGPEVFRLRPLRFVASVGGHRYSSRAMARVFRQIIRDVPLNELPIDVMLAATRVKDGKPFYFVRDCPANAQTTGRLSLVDCVTASAAAPTYFDPYEIAGFGRFVDGGVGIAGNPVYQACVEAFYYRPPGEYLARDSVVVSLGTGFYRADANPRTLFDWANWVVGELLRIPSEQQTELVQRHFDTLGMYRLNPPLTRDIGLDDLQAIPELVRIGHEAAAAIPWDDILHGRATPAGAAPARGGLLDRNVP